MKLYKNADQYYLFRPLDKPFIERYFKTSGRRNSAFSEVKVYKCQSQASIIDELQPDDSQYLKEALFSWIYGFGTVSIITKVDGPHDKVTNLRPVAVYLTCQPMGNLEVKPVNVKVIDDAEIAAIQNYFAQLDVIENLETTGALRIPHQKLEQMHDECRYMASEGNKLYVERTKSRPRSERKYDGGTYDEPWFKCEACNERLKGYVAIECDCFGDHKVNRPPFHDCPVVKEWNKNNPPTQRELDLEAQKKQKWDIYCECEKEYNRKKKELVQSMQPVPPL